ncbi:MAG: DNA methyltransferase [Candidatus Buchananbacteria bacterium]
MDIKFKEKIIKLFRNDARFWDTEKEELNQTLLKDAVDKFGEKVIETLLADSEAKKQFFVKVKDAYIFKPNDFKFFLDENKLDNSYTQLANKIGLATEEISSEKVVLNWPFKDCVLEGGMTKEDAMDVYFKYDTKIGEWKEEKAKRKEIFFNEVLARDEIDRLEEPKTFYKWKRFTEKNYQKGEDVKEIKRDKDGNIKENLVIKGNNLLALYSLKEQFEGKIKLIYIDPPYNTGSDSFSYNDNFNHSSWLTFMKNRLQVARNLLADDGLIFVQIGHNEQAYLRVLMDEVFSRARFVNEITWKKYSGVKNQASKKLTTQQETIFLYSKTENYSINMVYNELSEKYVKDEYKYIDENGRRYAKLRGRGYQGGGKGTKIKYLDENLGSPITTLWDEDFLQISTSSSEKIADFVGQKPESLLKRIIELTTNPGDVVLDYHAGTGTTCAVAHKIGRQWIGVEQLDYSENNPEERMRGVIAGDKNGISKGVNWKGGGDFIYIQLAKWNEEAKEKIAEVKSYDELTKLFANLYEKYFLNYNVKAKDFKENDIKSEEFKKISLSEQKKMVARMLDLNQMYINFSERKDKKYNLLKDDIALSEEFYDKK